jgi:hypothetical protein
LRGPLPSSCRLGTNAQLSSHEHQAYDCHLVGRTGGHLWEGKDMLIGRGAQCSPAGGKEQKLRRCFPLLPRGRLLTCYNSLCLGWPQETSSKQNGKFYYEGLAGCFLFFSSFTTCVEDQTEAGEGQSSRVHLVRTKKSSSVCLCCSTDNPVSERLGLWRRPESRVLPPGHGRGALETSHGGT